jgi:gamma-glutamyl:cysteine ligase YbdK (ATP-grasp superfamily)
MTIAWLQLVGGPYVTGTPDRRSFQEDFSGQVTHLAWKALSRLEAKLIDEYDGAARLAQGGYERVALHLEYRAKKHGRDRRAVGISRRLLVEDPSPYNEEPGDGVVGH